MPDGSGWDAGGVDGTLVSIALVVVFVLVGGYFSCSELALVTLRDSQVARLAQTSGRGKRVAHLRESSNRFLAAVQIGVTLAGFFSAAYGGSTLAVSLAPVLTGWGVPGGLSATLALLVVTILISFVSLVLGELAPKRLALQRAERVSLFVAPVLDRIALLARPVIWLLSVSTDAVVRLIGLDPGVAGEEIGEAELREMVGSQQDLGEDERRLLTDVFDSADRQLSAVMVPRPEVAFLPGATTVADAVDLVRDQPHSRYPVTGSDADDVLGFVHVRDLFSAVEADGAAPVSGLARPVTVLPGSAALLPTLMRMRSGGGHLALVVDEYGGTAGIVTLEDLVEEIVGDIRDEFDVPELAPAAAGRRRELDGRLHRDEVREQTGIELPEGRFDTLAGFVVARLGRLAEVGDTVTDLGHRFAVEQVEGHRVARVRVTAAPPDGTAGGSGEVGGPRGTDRPGAGMAGADGGFGPATAATRPVPPA